jgi:Flp pilus assembly protein protease CpaA
MRLGRSVKRLFLWIVVVAVLAVGTLLYRSRSKSTLNVEPHAREVIEKAKRR